MRLKLFHQFFAVIVLTALVAELAMALAFGLSLRAGFDGYLAARDAEDLAQVADTIQTRLASDTGAPALHMDRPGVGDLLPDIGLGPPSGPPPPPGLPPPGAPPPEAPPASGAEGPPGVGPPPWAGPPDTFAARLQIFDETGRQVIGPPSPPDGPEAGRIQTRTIRVRGVGVGRVAVIPRRRSPSGVDGRFLITQFESGAGIGALILILCVAPAWMIAGAATRRLEEIRSATRAVANGDFSIVLRPRGAIEVADTIGNINLMTGALQRLDTARRRWLAEASHELRTPLAALRGELDAMIDGVRPTTRAGLYSLNEEALRLNVLVDDLHLVAMADLDAPICQAGATDAAELCRRAIDRFAETATAKSLMVTLTGAGQAVRVTWDATRMERVLANLLTNSLRYTDPPGEIRVSLQLQAERVTIVVEDSAPCPSDEHLPQLFEPLYRVDDHRSRASGGSGLGLSICAAIVRAHGGAIVAGRSRLGGLAVTLDLPMIAAPA
jgi:two-component system sensor histidine kinase BaeS